MLEHFKKHYVLDYSLFAWFISHQPAVFFSQNKPATSNQPAVLFSQNKPAPAISHQPNEQVVHHYGKHVLCRALERLENARQRFCCAFFVKAHDKGHTIAFCMVNSLCRAPSSITHGEQTLPCVTCGARQTKVTDDMAGVTDGAPEETASKGLCRVAGMGRTAKNGTFAVRLTLSRTTIKTKNNKKIQHDEQLAGGHHTAPGTPAVGPPLHPHFSPPAASRSGGREREAVTASMRHYRRRPSSEGEGGVVLAVRHLDLSAHR
jgi:hypothetical protein